MFEHLFSPGKIGTMETKNRIVFTPMGNALANVDGTVSEKDIAFYGERAKGGVGVVFTECAIVTERGRGNEQQISVQSNDMIPGLTRLANEIHKYDGKVVVQIYHPGRQGISVVNGNLPMMAPSDVPCKLVQQPTVAMTKEEIQDLVIRFADAAKRLQKSDIDGVEVHAAHGYLINEFLSPYTNRRTDEYGGSFENRFRILDEIIQSIRERCGKDYPVIVRISADEFLGSEEGLHIDDSIKIAKRLEKLGVDAINVSSGIYETMNKAWEPASFKQGWKIHLPETIKKAVDIPVIGVSVIRDPEFADEMIKEEKIDFAGSARQHFADPHWSNKAKEGKLEDIKKCISCLHCMDTLMASGNGLSSQCAINIQTCNELIYNDIKEDGNGRVVVIIGAGPAGLEAARVLALRKFKPIIFEKTNQVGGQLQLAKEPPQKEKISWLINYLKTQVEKEDVEIRLGVSPTLADIEALNPYAIFIAQGSNPIMPQAISGINDDKVLNNTEILSGNAILKNKRIAVVGSGMTGLETAHMLAENKNEVHVFEMADDIGPGLYFQNLMDVMGHIGALGVQCHPKHKLMKIENGKATFEKTDTNEIVEDQFDYIIISLGTSPNTENVEELQAKFDQVSILGDANKAGRIRNAIEEGFVNAYNLT